MSNQYGVAVWISDAEFAAGHVSRITDSRNFDAARQQPLAQTNQVGRVHVEQHRLRRSLYRFFRAHEHDCATFTVQACPAQGLGAIGVDGESQSFVELDGLLDCGDMKKWRRVTSFR